MCVCVCVCMLELQPASPPCGSSIKGGSGQPHNRHWSASAFPLFHSHNAAPGNATTVIRVIRRFETRCFMLRLIDLHYPPCWKHCKAHHKWHPKYWKCDKVLYEVNPTRTHSLHFFVSRSCPAFSRSRGWYFSLPTGPNSHWSQRVCFCTCRSVQEEHCVFFIFLLNVKTTQNFLQHSLIHLSICCLLHLF